MSKKKSSIKKMSIEDLHEILDPSAIWENALGNEANEHSFYLYQLHNYQHDTWGAHLWTFNSVEDFKSFTPALIFSDAINYVDNLNEEQIEELDFSSGYAEYLKIIKENWDEARCIEFVKTYDGYDIKLIEFGRISSLFEISQEAFDQCRNESISEELLERTGLTEAQCQIMIQYSNVSETPPQSDKEGFLEFLNEDINDYLC